MSSLPHARKPPLELRVPASTSNLGPGFDCLGLALDLELHVRVRARDPTTSGWKASGHAAAWPADGGLFRAAFESVAGARAFEAFAFEIDSAIPIGRGFGSSGAAVAAGLFLGAALGVEALALEELVRLGIELEGHPDNVTASLHGGLTLCHPAPGDGGPPPVLCMQPHASLGWVLAWPRDGLSTEEARAALPPTVPFDAAADNPRRLALLLEGLQTGDERLIRLGQTDALHVAHRLPLIPGARRALEAAQAAGAWLATISGAGSGLVAAGPPARMDDVARALALGLEGEARVVRPAAGASLV